MDITKVDISRSYISDLLVAPESTYIIDMSRYRDIFEAIKDKLVSTPGLYLKNNYSPVIRFSSNHYVLVDGQYWCINEPKDVFENTSDIYVRYKHNFDLYVHRETLTKAQQNLNTQTDYDYTHILFAKEFIDTVVNSLVCYNYPNSVHNLYTHIKPRHRGYIDEELYHRDFDELYSEVYNYVSPARWHLYFTRIIGNAILLEKTVDYRVYQWCLSQVEEKENG